MRRGDDIKKRLQQKLQELTPNKINELEKKLEVSSKKSMNLKEYIELLESYIQADKPQLYTDKMTNLCRVLLQELQKTKNQISISETIRRYLGKQFNQASTSDNSNDIILYGILLLRSNSISEQDKKVDVAQMIVCHSANLYKNLSELHQHLLTPIQQKSQNSFELKQSEQVQNTKNSKKVQNKSSLIRAELTQYMQYVLDYQEIAKKTKNLIGFYHALILINYEEKKYQQVIDITNEAFLLPNFEEHFSDYYKSNFLFLRCLSFSALEKHKETIETGKKALKFKHLGDNKSIIENYLVSSLIRLYDTEKNLTLDDIDLIANSLKNLKKIQLSDGANLVFLSSLLEFTILLAIENPKLGMKLGLVDFIFKHQYFDRLQNLEKLRFYTSRLVINISKFQDNLISEKDYREAIIADINSAIQLLSSINVEKEDKANSAKLFKSFKETKKYFYDSFFEATTMYVKDLNNDSDLQKLCDLLVDSTQNVSIPNKDSFYTLLFLISCAYLHTTVSSNILDLGVFLNPSKIAPELKQIAPTFKLIYPVIVSYSDLTNCNYVELSMEWFKYHPSTLTFEIAFKFSALKQNMAYLFYLKEHASTYCKNYEIFTKLQNLSTDHDSGSDSEHDVESEEKNVILNKIEYTECAVDNKSSSQQNPLLDKKILFNDEKVEQKKLEEIQNEYKKIFIEKTKSTKKNNEKKSSPIHDPRYPVCLGKNMLSTKMVKPHLFFYLDPKLKKELDQKIYEKAEEYVKEGKITSGKGCTGIVFNKRQGWKLKFLGRIKGDIRIPGHAEKEPDNTTTIVFDKIENHKTMK